jgi:uncharacterized membrane protein YeaQ/YmgE (transglycosylase-associated protein family)
MGLLLTLLLGGLAGWLASMLMNRDAEQGVLLNIVVGVVGAFLANLVLAPLLGVPAVLDQVTLWGFVMAVLGAVVLLAIVNLFTRKRLR